MHLQQRKCDLPLNSLTSNSHRENKSGVVFQAQQGCVRSSETILVILENPLHLEEIYAGWSIYDVKQADPSWPKR